MEEKTITFISDRKTYTLPIASILYVMMKKQDAYVHVSDGKTGKNSVRSKFIDKYKIML